MSEHTPGPCVAISRHNGTVNIETITGSILGMSMKTDRLTYTEVRANAILWAASPELLEACEATVAVLSEHEQYDPPEDDETYPSAEHVAAEAARAAIAKAKGEVG